MRFFKKRWVLVLLLALFYLGVSVGLLFGPDVGLYSDRFFYFALTFVTLAGIYFVYKLINLSRWGGVQLWKKVAVASVISLVLTVSSLIIIIYLSKFRCYQWPFDWECSQYDDVPLFMFSLFTPLGIYFIYRLITRSWLGKIQLWKRVAIAFVISPALVFFMLIFPYGYMRDEIYHKMEILNCDLRCSEWQCSWEHCEVLLESGRVSK